MDPKTVAVATEADTEWAAGVMAGSEPWITLGRNLESCLEICRRPEYQVFVARQGGRLCGFAALVRRGVAGSPYIASIAVAEGFRSSGIGSRLHGACDGAGTQHRRPLPGHNDGNIRLEQRDGGGIMNLGSNVGGFISPALTPVLAAQIGWNRALLVAATLSVVAAVMWLGISPACRSSAEGAAKESCGQAPHSCDCVVGPRRLRGRCALRRSAPTPSKPPPMTEAAPHTYLSCCRGIAWCYMLTSHIQPG
jgi:hypothetical protein